VLDISILGLWRWASRRGYVPLRIHSGGCGGEIKEVLENVVLGDIGRAGRGCRALLGPWWWWCSSTKMAVALEVPLRTRLAFSPD
jgi:hypothetical protein